MAINDVKWNKIKKLLDDAAKDKNLSDLFLRRKQEETLRKLKEYNISKEDLDEIHVYLEKVFSDSPLRWWWW